MSKAICTLLFVLELAVLVSVARADEPTSSAKNTFTVMLDQAVNPNHAALVVAQEKGFFAAENLQVVLQVPANPDDPSKLAGADKVNLAVGHQPQLHIDINAGVPIKRIGTLVSTPLSALVVLKSSPIKTLADLKGHKIGASGTDLDKALLKALLAHANLKLEEVELVNIGTSPLPALLSGQVDAAVGVSRNFDLNQMDLAKKPGRIFYPEEEGVAPYDALVLIAPRDQLNDPRLRRFLTALEQATLYTINHPDEAWQLFISHHKELDDELNQRAWRDTLPRLARRPAALDEVAYKRFAHFLAKLGVITVALPVSNYAVQLPLPE